MASKFFIDALLEHTVQCASLSCQIIQEQHNNNNNDNLYIYIFHLATFGKKRYVHATVTVQTGNKEKTLYTNKLNAYIPYTMF